MGKNNSMIAALDIGTKSVTTVIAQKGEDGAFSVIGKGVAENNKGLIAGDVVDVQATAAAIRDSVSEAEQISSKRVRKVFVSVSGEGIRSINNHGVIQVRGQEVAKTDMNRVIEQAKLITMPDDSQIVSVEIGKYTVDGKAGIVNPIGMACRMLEVDVLIVTMPKTMSRNLYKAVEDAGFFVSGMVVSAIASSWAVLEEDEKNLGAAMVDIGDGVADIAIYCNGDPVYVAVMPMGGKFITDDISKVMKIPPVEAEKIKCKHGNVRPEYVSDTEVFETVVIGTNAPMTKKAKQLATVITPRVEEIMIEIKKKLRESQKEGLIHSDIVLTGGTSQLKNIQCIAEDFLEQTVRLGTSKVDDPDSGFQDVLSSPTCATAVGIIKYFSNHKQMVMKKNGWMARVADIFRNFFE
ncbi:cell division protein FtsA [bacterium]|nr:cell division protein FtsA [bacterium]MBP5590308.1 cell division protein FtsA [bacterium]